jgi:hypothetical protein
MLHWARLLIALFALSTALAAGATGAFAAKKGPPCMAMMEHGHHGAGATTDHRAGGCDGDDAAACCTPACCFVALLSGPCRILAAVPLSARVAMPFVDDLRLSGSRAPPDLRPPIA